MNMNGISVSDAPAIAVYAVYLSKELEISEDKLTPEKIVPLFGMLDEDYKNMFRKRGADVKEMKDTEKSINKVSFKL